MADVITFPWRWVPLYRTEPGFTVRVMPNDGLWLVVSRKHSWDFSSRSSAQAFAREIADSFGVSMVVHMRGAA
jgi:hypothetical protein